MSLIGKPYTGSYRNGKKKSSNLINETVKLSDNYSWIQTTSIKQIPKYEYFQIGTPIDASEWRLSVKGKDKLFS